MRNDGMPSRAFSPNIQAARAFAALAVVAYHMHVLPFGQAGVDVFFVISGFIMSWVAPGEGRTFFRKRLVRIVPLYWVTTLGIYAIAVLRPHWLNSTTAAPEYLIKSLLFVPYVKENGHWGPLNLNGWTLEYEMLFYVVVAASLVGVRARFATAFAALMLASFCLWATIDGTPGTVAHHLGQPIVLEFALGVVAYRVLQTGFVRRVATPAWVLAACVAVAAIPLSHALFGTPQAFARIALWGIPSCVLIVALIALDIRNWSITNRIMAALGAASYSIYLIHPYVIGIAKKIVGVRADLHTWAGIAAACATLCAVCGCGYVCHVWIERPMVAALNQWLQKSRIPARSL
ncbi:acyltransferase [Burkholderia cepacia]|uniref:acyltransferase family protein n=1 Tax=Burkholderia cepacia TaxID=292 RepID=UPI00075DE220|nr:acyltransferase [Burkholderia cepacia]KVA59013.1 acyltransferase [Burkholderia cepacia]KVA63615.1 acyltransferase [Burkholderia cepacia]KVA86006.1 acyltransferase [Burkholderia cepacia]KVA88490.1 acyltransferase [Burkholderia cepacia]KVA99276.1 acyltransferase [Burkholderia cepacia]